MIPFFDSHAHLAGEAFDEDRASVLHRARDAGAAGVVCIGESLEAAAGARRLADRYPGYCYWTAGIHPHDAASFDAEAHPPFLRELLDHGAVAVGECGLDYHYDNAPRWKQRQLFSAQIALAADLRKPLVVHTRDAADDTAAMMEAASEAGVTGVLHCFTGPQALAERALAAGWYLSFSGIITFRKWEDDALLRIVPDDRLLVESDAPYLAPVPFRGKRNEPAWVRHTVERLARARGIEPEALGALTIRNAHRFFGVAMDDAVAV